jgi:F0F1-type ATP synthase delta subunit
MRVTNSQYAEAFYELSRTKESGSTQDLARSLFAFLKRKKELKKLPAIMRKMEQLQDAQKGIRGIFIATAFPVSDVLKKEMEAFAKKTFESKEVLLDVKIQKSLLGGMILQTETQLVDASVAGKLQQLRRIF